MVPIAVCVAVLLPALAAGDAEGWRGVVVGPTGAAVSGARVTLAAGGRSAVAHTDSSGRFDVTAGSVESDRGGVISLAASGFTTLRQPVDLTRADLGLFTLALAPKTEEVVVSALRSAGW